MNDSIEVLVIGAGPAGLTTALALARYGVPVRIIDHKHGPTRHTKATNLMQRNQELIAALGALEPLAAQSGKMRRLMVTAYGADLGPRTMRLNESPYTDVLLCGQDRFEQVMVDALADAGVEVEWGTEFVALQQQPDKVVITVQAPDGRSTELDAAWVAACDGAAGRSRSFTRLDFTPERTGVAIRQVDCTLTWRRSLDAQQMWLFYFTRGFGVVVPLPDGIHRIITIEPKDAIPEREPTLEEMQTALRTMADDPSALLTEERWTSYTDLAMGIAPALRDQRVFLVGDVGNPILPNGGQGMNTGIADGYDLAWKLAAHVDNGAPERLLDTYNEERHALRKALQKTQYASLKYTTLSTPAPMRAAFRLLAGPILDHGGEYRVAQAFSELTLNTRRSPVTLDTMGRHGLRAGDRALDAPARHNGAPVQLYDLLYQGGWTLLAFEGRGRHRSPDRVRTALAQLGATPARQLRVASVDGPWPEVDTLWDLDGEVHRRYGIDRPALVLIRPDGHITARTRTEQYEAMRSHMATWGPSAAQRFAEASSPLGDRA